MPNYLPVKEKNSSSPNEQTLIMTNVLSSVLSDWISAMLETCQHESVEKNKIY